jgi:cyclophilin family peptidyl-prolyl cis-trans isomerase
LELTESRAFDSTALFRAVTGFLVQFGIPRTAELRERWLGKTIEDDPDLSIPITRGIISFAGSEENSRDTQVFMPFQHLSFLGKSPWERPFGFIVSGTSALDSVYTGYGDLSPDLGKGPDQRRIHAHDGYAYLSHEFPLLSYVDECRIVAIRPNSSAWLIFSNRTKTDSTKRTMNEPVVPHYDRKVLEFESRNGFGILLLMCLVLACLRRSSIALQKKISLREAAESLTMPFHQSPVDKVL